MSAPAALEPTAVAAPSPVRQVPGSQASAQGTMAPQAAASPAASAAAKVRQPTPVEVAKTLEQALEIARTQPQPPPSPAIAKAKSLHEAIEAVQAAEREAKGEPPMGTAGINPFATAAGK
ncbi:MAG TPA: hypothetical protein VK996_02880 [Ramlibacter sp.]|nr:hypothetical protein [Ramlibacter sp.]